MPSPARALYQAESYGGALPGITRFLWVEPMNQSFYMCLEETVIRLDLPFFFYSLRGIFLGWIYQCFFVVFVLVSCQGSFATDSCKQMLGVYEERSLTKRYCTGPW